MSGYTDQELDDHFVDVCAHYLLGASAYQIAWHPMRPEEPARRGFNPQTGTWDITEWPYEDIEQPTRAQLRAFTPAEVEQSLLYRKVVHKVPFKNQSYTFQLTGPWEDPVDYTLQFDFDGDVVTMRLPRLEAVADGEQSAIIETTTGLELLRPEEEWVAMIVVIEGGQETIGCVRFSAVDGKIRIYQYPYQAFATGGTAGFVATTAVFKKGV